jgi:DNA (cytosine-5)-methyltransferase 1
MSRPRLLDLFCCAGGMSMGFHRAGFDVTGIDREPQPRYPFAFVRADALEYASRHGKEYDAIHASPPCQHFSYATAWRGDRKSHPDLLAPTRAVLDSCGRPYVIENVEAAARKMLSPLILCGSMFGLSIRRHRCFELSWCPLLLVPACRHQEEDFAFDHGGKQTESQYRDAMGCHWMTAREARQAIPPADAEFIGGHLVARLEASHAA